MINKDGGDNFLILWGGHGAHGGFPAVHSPIRENPGLSNVCTKLEPGRSETNEILEINVLQKFSPHALSKHT